MSRRPNTDKRRAEIVKALLAAMAEHGYEKATIQLIAQKAGMAPGLLHYHFASKREMLLELVKALVELSRRRYDEFVQSATTPEEKLHAYFNARLGMGRGANAAAVAAWVVIGTEAVRQSDVRDVYQEAVKAELVLLRGLLSEYLKAKKRQARNIQNLAASILAMMEGAFQLASAAGGVMPKGYAAETAFLLVQRYVDGEKKALKKGLP